MLESNTYGGNATIRWGLFLVLLLLADGLKAQVDIEISSGVTTEITGDLTIEVNGDWINNGTLEPGNSLFVFSGTQDQNVLNVEGSFYMGEITKAGGNVICLSDLTIEGTLNVLSGDCDLNGFLISMPNGGLNEAVEQTVLGASGYLVRQADFGIAAGDLGFGFHLWDAGDIGVADVYRGHDPQAGNGNLSISRWYRIDSPVPLPNSADIMIRYDDSELGAQDENALSLFKSLDNGVSWELVVGSLDVILNTFTADNVGDMGLVTLSAFDLSTTSCLWDLDIDGDVDTADLLIFLGAFGCSFNNCVADFNNDGETNTEDLLEFLGHFGSNCN